MKIKKNSKKRLLYVTVKAVKIFFLFEKIQNIVCSQRVIFCSLRTRFHRNIIKKGFFFEVIKQTLIVCMFTATVRYILFLKKF